MKIILFLIYSKRKPGLLVKITKRDSNNYEYELDAKIAGVIFIMKPINSLENRVKLITNQNNIEVSNNVEKTDVSNQLNNSCSTFNTKNSVDFINDISADTNL